jgi:hypothetical protein
MPELTDSKKPADWVTLEYKEGQNLFDDYFKAALRGVSTVAACTIAGDVPMKAAGFAMEIAKEAMKKREEYFSELAMRHQ